MRAKDGNRLPALDEQRLVIAESFESRDNGVERLPAPRRPSRPAVDHKVIRTLGDIRVQVVHDHPQRGFLLPPPTADL